jgi:peptidoglycan/LPS O-acetylase OafA/YrhL
MGHKQERNQWLDLCRAVAVCLVVASHGFELLRNPAIATVQSVFGAMGVEIFFCLSGFLIGTIFINATRDFDGSPGVLLNFMARRWMRTLPNYYFYLALNAWLFWIGWTVVKEAHITPYVFFVQSLFWPHPDFFPEAWSLAVEEVFYLLLPITFLTAWYALRKSMPALIVALLVMLVASMGMRYRIAITDLPWDAYIRKIAVYRLDSLMWGVLLAILHYHLRGRRDGALRAIGMVMLCFLPLPIFAFTTGIAAMPQIVYRLLILTFASIGICGVISLGMNVRLPSGVAIVSRCLANWSYSMYLANMPVYYTFINYVEPNVKFSSPLVEFGCDLVAVVAAAIVTYNCIEKPFLAMRARLFPDRNGPEQSRRGRRFMQSSN